MKTLRAPCDFCAEQALVAESDVPLNIPLPIKTYARICEACADAAICRFIDANFGVARGLAHPDAKRAKKAKR